VPSKNFEKYLGQKPMKEATNKPTPRYSMFLNFIFSANVVIEQQKEASHRLPLKSDHLFFAG
jgi:hypothetical protein